MSLTGKIERFYFCADQTPFLPVPVPEQEICNHHTPYLKYGQNIVTSSFWHYLSVSFFDPGADIAV
jgi:hypothetical protein